MNGVLSLPPAVDSRRDFLHTQPMNLLRFLTNKGWQNVPVWLEQPPRWLIITLGAGAGLGLGLPGFFFLRSPLWVLAWVLVFGALGWLGWRAEPVFWEAIPEAPQPRPARRPGPHQVRDGPLLMMALPGGPFRIGSPDTDDIARDNEKPQHQVTVSALRMAITPVTAGLYAEVMGKETPAAARAQLPVVEVSWYEAIEFCNALSVRQGYHPCYHREGEQVVCDWQADGYRLPTEAEWEYACRAGTTTRYAFCLLYTSPSPRDGLLSRMPSSA